MATEKKRYTVYIKSNGRDDTERFIGTPKGNYLVQTGKPVEVPKDVKEVIELMEIQQASIDNIVDDMRLKD